MSGDPVDMARLADTVAALGTPAFPDAFLALVQSLTRADLVSAFALGGDDSAGLRYILAAGQHPEIAGFAVSASLAYAREFWRRDRATRHALATPRDRVRVVRQAAAGLLDAAHRTACYDRAGIVERVTLYGAGPHPVMASCYRHAGQALSRPDELDRLERCAPVLLALVARHDAVVASPRATLDLAATTGVLHARCPALSAREAEVAAGMALGLTQAQLADRLGVALHSIVTYRRRAYRKMGIAARGDLAAWIAAPISVDNHT